MRLAFLLLGLLLSHSVLHAQTDASITQEVIAWPRNVEEFAALQTQLGRTPEGSASLLLIAFQMYSQNARLGEQALTLIVHPELLVQSATGYKGYALRASDLQLLKLQLRTRTINSYVVNTDAKNDYALPAAGPWHYAFRKSETLTDPNANRYKLFVICTGADAPRPIMLHREPSNANGMWYVQDWSALLMPVR